MGSFKRRNANEGIYTIAINEMENGHDNLGNTIPELTETQFDIQQVQNNQTTEPTKIIQNNMPPITGETWRCSRKKSISIDVIITIVVLVWLVIIEVGWIPSVRRGFYCDDRSIQYELRGDTVSTMVLLSSIFVPFFIVWLVERIFYVSKTIKITKFSGSLRKTLKWSREYAIGIILHFVILDGVKVTVGELRPHFIHTCLPNAYFNCTGSEYIEDYTCTNTEISPFLVRDASKSFPSLHSSTAFFEGIFLVWYFQRRLPNLGSKLIKPLIQSLIISWSFFCALTRIVDHRHHWWDVLIGSILGCIFAGLTCAIRCKNFNSSTSQNEDQIGPTNFHNTSIKRLLSNSSAKDDVALNRTSEP